ncbi:ATP-binding protein [Methanocorpusculum vombati]|uniref:DUF4143 domain-containing protein n=1 Tax=Methanocorpusculum vombati TaxID=3002864 RepID=A0ABT4IKV9_9EURY|nr:DUF4143 domain-containing protein [Methanocorpusculum vombati]MCZ9319247.1 DUF4143 domain-containing protein [Methanocorpusculum sp.]MCZ0862389.1 DUF4143 domain-containing protein [Methanocorpusculum vombati]MDE2521064.1 DUF4143 domain-containing protein [Methanocorpusculum sp.]MDE2534290.1 DUF4143 domain-containing protein [Methanocorpusculum sp.]MDE2546669.1 DUF4143 domain-containing protein [Methanocorpusculum sp.]
MTPEYIPRIADILLKESLASSGAVLIEGPKWCGKTWTAKHAAKSVLYLQDPDKTSSYLQIADTKPSLLLKGETPRLLDEWQMAPVLWDAVRFTVDQRQKTGQFILTGSASPQDNLVQHTGTGRISRIFMRPMSLFESGESNGTVSLSSLFAREPNIDSISSLSIEDLAAAITRGGWPASVTGPEETAFKRAIDYSEAVINHDISKVDGVEKNPARVRSLLRSLARNTASMATITTIKNDMALDEAGLSEKTISGYLSALKRIFVIEDQPAWSPALLSRTAIRTSAKRHFIDPSIAAAVLRATPKRLLEDFNTFGILFESLCIRDLRIYASLLDGEIFHYHDRNDLEADAIIQLHDGRWGAVEIKLGSRSIDEAANNLHKLKNKIDTGKMQEPSFLLVLTGGEFAYRRDDGVYIVPIGCLKP